jgi:hypothetical protein
MVARSRLTAQRIAKNRQYARKIMVATSKKLEPNDDTVRASVTEILSTLYEESIKYSEPEEVHVKLLLCAVLTVLTNSSKDKKNVVQNVEYFTNFITEQMAIAVEERFK